MIGLTPAEYDAKITEVRKGLLAGMLRGESLADIQARVANRLHATKAMREVATHEASKWWSERPDKRKRAAR